MGTTLVFAMLLLSAASGAEELSYASGNAAIKKDACISAHDSLLLRKDFKTLSLQDGCQCEFDEPRQRWYCQLGYRTKEQQAAFTTEEDGEQLAMIELERLKKVMKTYFKKHGAYTDNLQLLSRELKYKPDEEIEIIITSADGYRYKVTARHKKALEVLRYDSINDIKQISY